MRVIWGGKGTLKKNFLQSTQHLFDLHNNRCTLQLVQNYQLAIWETFAVLVQIGAYGASLNYSKVLFYFVNSLRIFLSCPSVLNVFCVF